MRKNILAMIFVSVFAMSVAFVGCAKKEEAKPAAETKTEAPAADAKADAPKADAKEAAPTVKAGKGKAQGC